MEKLPSNLAVMSKREKQKAAAFAIVAEDIDPANWEKESIRG